MTDIFNNPSPLLYTPSMRKGLVPLNRLSQRKNFDIAPTRKIPLQIAKRPLSSFSGEEKYSHRREREVETWNRKRSNAL